MNIFKVVIAGLLAMGVLSQVEINEDPKFLQELEAIVGSLREQEKQVTIFVEREDVDTAVV